MFNKILVANRGEIAVRIIRACRELGIRTVAIFSEPDRDALHTKIADESICIGPAQSKNSYLNIKSILAACDLSSCDAIHPGFGFLSENAYFARKCAQCEVEFIGPSPESIELMGNKIAAKNTMRMAGIPIIPGSNGAIETIDQAKKICDAIGYPVMIKASAGGGGRGIRLVHSPDSLDSNFVAAQQEALAFFGDGSLYIEKFLINPKHIEIQLLADKFGNIIHLADRDCSIQRRNQKLVEEAPSIFISDELRNKMGEMAKVAAKACNYYNAGTIEFLVDSSFNFYFMEMNTRIQVEHPITELITGVDIVKQQILIACNKRLEYNQTDIKLQGHSIECRINAENPNLNFRPSPGKIRGLHMPGGFGVRIDSCVYPGCIISPYYDSMIAKLIVHAKTRKEAIAKMKGALAEFLVEGVDTNIDLHLDILRSDKFLCGDYNIGFLDNFLKN